MAGCLPSPWQSLQHHNYITSIVWKVCPIPLQFWEIGARVVADVWEKDIWDFQAKSGSSGSCRLLLHFIVKIALEKMCGKMAGSPRHSSSTHPRLSEERLELVIFGTLETEEQPGAVPDWKKVTEGLLGSLKTLGGTLTLQPLLFWISWRRFPCSRDLKASAERKPLFFSRGWLLFQHRARVGGSGEFSRSGRRPHRSCLALWEFAHEVHA